MKKNYSTPDIDCLEMEVDVVLISEVGSSPTNMDDFYDSNVFGGWGN